MDSKKLIMFGAVVGMVVGSLVPMLFGDNNLLGGGSILGSLIGGFVGIWVAYKVAQRLG